MTDPNCEELSERFDDEWLLAMAELLDRLLTTRPGYLIKWQRRLRGRVKAELSQSAVARVIAEHRHEGGGPVPDAEFTSAKTLVVRALQGKRLTRPTLDLFIETFAIEGKDLEDLEWLWERRELASVHGELATAWMALVHETPEILTARRYQRTVQLEEQHTVGPDRTPVAHRTRQVIEAMSSGPDRHIYIHDAPDAVVTIEKGGTAGRLLQLSESLVGLEILYEAPLVGGEHRILVYETQLHYSEPTEPNFRRAAIRRVDSMTILVRFHPTAVPHRIWWCTWPALELPADSREEVQLDADLTVERFVHTAWDKTFGFEWQWDPDLTPEDRTEL